MSGTCCYVCQRALSCVASVGARAASPAQGGSVRPSNRESFSMSVTAAERAPSTSEHKCTGGHAARGRAGRGMRGICWGPVSQKILVGAMIVKESYTLGARGRPGRLWTFEGHGAIRCHVKHSRTFEPLAISRGSRHQSGHGRDVAQLQI